MRSNQAVKIMLKFGGARPLARAINKDPSGIYKWNYDSTKGGNNGFIPAPERNIPLILDAADRLGVQLTAEDFNPIEQKDLDIFS